LRLYGATKREEYLFNISATNGEKKLNGVAKVFKRLEMGGRNEWKDRNFEREREMSECS
jgi:hypothetical protein